MRRGVVVVVFLVAALAAGWLACSPGTAAKRPNVIMIVMDTTRADRCSVQGYGRETTPRLERFAKDAVVFTEAWSPAGWTGPAHASLFTGLRAEHHGFYTGNRLSLPAAIPTLSELLRAEGYATGCFTNNELIGPNSGLNRAFDRFEPFFEDDTRPYPWAVATHTVAAGWAAEQANAHRPFFLFVNDMEPHLKFTPTAEDEAKFVRGNPTPAAIAEMRAWDYPHTIAYSAGAEELTPAQLALLSDLYDAEIATLDREVGVLLDRLRADGLLDSTVIVILGDHGESIGEHGTYDHGHGLHSQLLHVPLLMRFPGSLDGGRKVDDLVRLEDVAPTLLELCGLAPIDASDGVSLTGGLRGRVARGIFGEQTHAMEQIARAFPGADLSIYRTSIRSVYDGRLHLLRYSTGREELFDVKRDPGETSDLAPQGGEDLARLRALLPN